MISNIELKNVRLFDEDGQSFSLSPLTLICGTNNSGKSTILKSLLLIKQSQGRGSVGRPRFIGSHVDFGSYEAFVHKNESDRNIEVSLTVDDEMPSNMGSDLYGIEQEADHIIPYSLKGTFSFRKSVALKPTKAQISWAEDSEINMSDSPILYKSSYILTAFNQQIMSWDFIFSFANVRRDAFYNLHIDREYLQSDHIPSQIKQKIKSQKTSASKLPVITSGFFPTGLMIKSKTPTSDEIFPMIAIPQIYFPLNDFQAALGKVTHIAPLRAPAQRFYIASNDRKLDAVGNFLPDLLMFSKLVEVTNIRPKDNTTEKVPLAQALNEWMYYIRTGEVYKESAGSKNKEIEITAIKQAVVEIKLKSPIGGSHALLDSGVGYSQLLPIIVKVLQVQVNSTILIEQPELHLNPAIQVRLVDFFVAMMKSGRQLIIETHSEHIVNALRALIAEDEEEKLASKACIYFIDTTNGFLDIYDFTINKDGTLSDWPKGFFGEANNLTGRILKAQKRALEKKRN